MKKLSLVMIFLILLVGCGNKEKPSATNSDSSLGKYLFIGDNYIIHKTENCYALRHGRDDYGHRVYGKTYVDTLEFVFDPALSFCTRCIGSADYERIIAISQSNAKKQNIKKPNPMN